MGVAPIFGRASIQRQPAMRYFFMVLLLLLLTGCPDKRPAYRLKVWSEKNRLCFMAPDEFDFKQKFKPADVFISVWQDNSWKNIFHVAYKEQNSYIYKNECIIFPDVKWQSATYSVFIGVIADENGSRNALDSDFTLTIQPDGKILISERK
ncbi:putative T6SS immunity periplasmic lipoprotein [Enterobacteriaceae bacterium LUAb1]